MAFNRKCPGSLQGQHTSDLRQSGNGQVLLLAFRPVISPVSTTQSALYIHVRVICSYTVAYAQPVQRINKIDNVL